MFIHRLIIVLVIILSLTQSTKAQNSNFNYEPFNTSYNVGTLTANSQVNLAGKTTMNLEFTIPAGVNNFVPNIGLYYNQEYRGQFPFGKGFQITGLSKITRIPRDIHNDGRIEPINFTNTDVLALNGERLKLISGENLKPGAIYRTKYETWNKIECLPDANGGIYFVITSKHGDKMELGKGVNAKHQLSNANNTVTLGWAINKAWDHSTNTIFYHYTKNPLDGTFFVNRITYGGNEHNNTPNIAEIELKFYTTTQSSNAAISGFKLENNLLCTSITTKINGSVVRKYDFHFEIFKGNHHLMQILPFGQNGARLNSSQFMYGNHIASELSTYRISINLSDEAKGGTKSPIGRVQFMDLDNDGTDEMISFPNIPNPSLHLSDDQKLNRIVLKRNGNSFSDINYEKVYSGYTSFYGTHWATINSNFFNTSSNPGVYFRSFYTEPVAQSSSGNQNDPILYKRRYSSHYLEISDGVVKKNSLSGYRYEHYATALDIDGDGLTEELVFNDTTGVLLLIKENNEVPISTTVKHYEGLSSVDILPVYINSQYTPNILIRGKKNLTNLSWSNAGQLPAWINSDHVKILDFNSDGYTDFLIYNNSQWLLKIGLGLGEFIDANSLYQITNLQWLSTLPAPNQGSLLIFNDLDNNGYIDPILIRSKGAGHGTDSYDIENIIIYYNSGTGIFYNQNIPVDQIPFNYEITVNKNDLSQFHFTDIDGDGIRELVILPVRAGLDYLNNATQNYLDKIANDKLTVLDFNYTPDHGLLTKIRDGKNRWTKINYSGTNDHRIYNHLNQNQTYPRRSDRHTEHVVSKISYETRDANWHTTTFNYYAKSYSVINPGQVSYNKLIKLDSNTNIATVAEYSFDNEHQIFSLSRQSQFDKQAQKINQAEYDYEFFVGNGGTISKRLKLLRQENSLMNTHSTMENITWDDWGNILTKLTNHGNKRNIVEEYQYINSGSWCPNSILSIQTNSVGQGGNVMRKTNLVYKDSSPLPISIQTNYNNSEELRSSTFEYDSFGNLIRITKQSKNYDNIIESKTYSNDGRFVVAESLGGTTTYEYVREPIFGKILTTTDNNGNIVSNDFDEFQNLFKTTDAFGNTQLYDTHWINDKQFGISITKSFGQDQFIKKNKFDDNLVTTSEGKLGSSISIESKYDALGRQTMVSKPYKVNPLKYNTFEYDEYGRVKFQGTIDKAYSYEYDSFDGSKSITDILNRTKTSYFNQAGDLWKYKDANDSEILYTYDGEGRVINMSTDLKNVEYKLNVSNKVVLERDPDLGEIYVTYNDLDLPIRKQTANGIIFYEYDDKGRVTKSGEPGNETFYKYDCANSLNAPCEIYNNHRKTIFTYNSKGQLSNRQEQVDGKIYLYTYTYNPNGSLSSTKYPNGVRLDYNYSKTGEILAISLNGTILWTPLKTNDFNTYSEYFLGQIAVVKHFDYNNHPNKIELSNGQTILSSHNYEYNQANDNLVFRSNSYNQTESFEYDLKLDRLEKIKLNNDKTVNISFDKTGNITSKSDAGDYFYQSKQPSAVSKIMNLESATRNYVPHLIQYNVYNKAKKITNVTNTDLIISESPTTFKELELLYGYDHQRVITTYKEGIEEKWKKIYLPNYIVLESAGQEDSYALITTPSGDRIIISETGLIQYVVKDPLGSSLASFNNSPLTTIQEFSYDAWGLPRNPKNIEDYSSFIMAPLSFEFTGHEMYHEFKLINMNGRMYDPVIGRMMSPDPFIQDKQNPQNFNRYSYAFNNPLKYNDPSGYITEPLLKERDPIIVNNASGSSNYGFGNRNPWDVSDSYGWYSSHGFISNAQLFDHFHGGMSKGRVKNGGIQVPLSNFSGYLGNSNANRAHTRYMYSVTEYEKETVFTFGGRIFIDSKEAQGGGSPTIDKGGFVNSDGFYGYMLNHAKNTSVEVAAFELQKGNTGETRYFVLPWKNNLINKSRFSMNVSKYVEGYSQEDIKGLYHTHPGSTPPSGADRTLSDKYNLPIYSIGANGSSYFYFGGVTSPIDLSIYFGY